MNYAEEFKSTNCLGRKYIEEKLEEGKLFLVAVLSGTLGCADVCDACELSGSVLLYKRGLYYWIDTVDIENPENLLVTDDVNYIFDIVSWWKEIID